MLYCIVTKLTENTSMIQHGTALYHLYQMEIEDAALPDKMLL